MHAARFGLKRWLSSSSADGSKGLTVRSLVVEPYDRESEDSSRLLWFTARWLSLPTGDAVVGASGKKGIRWSVVGVNKHLFDRPIVIVIIYKEGVGALPPHREHQRMKFLRQPPEWRTGGGGSKGFCSLGRVPGRRLASMTDCRAHEKRQYHGTLPNVPVGWID